MDADLTKKPATYFSGSRPEMIKYMPLHAKKILEIGCGEGNFGAELKKRNIAEVWGIEYDNDQCAKASQKLDRAIPGDVMKVVEDLPANYFDLIVCNDVLEHLTDPYSLLRQFKLKLSQDGLIVSSIPNIRFFRTMYQYLFKRNWEYTDNGIMDKTHYRFFTERSIRDLFENQGYQILIHEGINPSKSIRPLLVNLFTLGYFSDIKFLQFATVAKVMAKK